MADVSRVLSRLWYGSGTSSKYAEISDSSHLFNKNQCLILTEENAPGISERFHGATLVIKDRLEIDGRPTYRVEIRRADGNKPITCNVTWQPVLGEAHQWPNRQALVAAMCCALTAKWAEIDYKKMRVSTDSVVVTPRGAEAGVELTNEPKIAPKYAAKIDPFKLGAAEFNSGTSARDFMLSAIGSLFSKRPAAVEVHRYSAPALDEHPEDAFESAIPLTVARADRPHSDTSVPAGVGREGPFFPLLRSVFGTSSGSKPAFRVSTALLGAAASAASSMFRHRVSHLPTRIPRDSRVGTGHSGVGRPLLAAAEEPSHGLETHARSHRKSKIPVPVRFLPSELPPPSLDTIKTSAYPWRDDDPTAFEPAFEAELRAYLKRVDEGGGYPRPINISESTHEARLWNQQYKHLLRDFRRRGERESVVSVGKAYIHRALLLQREISGDDYFTSVHSKLLEKLAEFEKEEADESLKSSPHKLGYFAHPHENSAAALSEKVATAMAEFSRIRQLIRDEYSSVTKFGSGTPDQAWATLGFFAAAQALHDAVAAFESSIIARMSQRKRVNTLKNPGTGIPRWKR